MPTKKKLLSEINPEQIKKIMPKLPKIEPMNVSMPTIDLSKVNKGTSHSLLEKAEFQQAQSKYSRFFDAILRNIPNTPPVPNDIASNAQSTQNRSTDQAPF